MHRIVARGWCITGLWDAALLGVRESSWVDDDRVIDPVFDQCSRGEIC